MAHAAAAIVAQAVCTMLMTMTPFPQLVVYIGFTLNFFAVMSVASLFLLRRRAGWQKLRLVSFCYPLFPALYLAVGVWMIFYGVQLKPYISSAAVVTVVTGSVDSLCPLENARCPAAGRRDLLSGRLRIMI
jgi:APA family basic amino acid/polyamine antiporter